VIQGFQRGSIYAAAVIGACVFTRAATAGEDKTPIVRETVTIRAHQAGEHGRYIDLPFEFDSLSDDVSIARRGE
jgi:hypothetical protein